MVDKFLLMLFLTNKNKIFYSKQLHYKKINNKLLSYMSEKTINKKKKDYLYKNPFNMKSRINL
jgi:hypothetical protein